MKDIKFVDYLKLCFDEEMPFIRSWRIAICMRLTSYDNRNDLIPYIEGRNFVFNYKGETYAITDRDTSKSVTSWVERHKVPKGFLINIKEPMETTLGRLLLNYLGFVVEFGDLAPYINDKIDASTFNNGWYKLYNAGHIKTTMQIFNSRRYIENLEADAEMGVPAASIETFTVDPKIIKRRDELFKEHAGNLNNPVVQAMIDKELTTMDKESMKGTQAANFILGNNIYGVVRKKTKFMYGSETDMEGKPSNFVPTPLSDGLQIEDMDGFVNIGRAGSFSRGKLTALGGYGVKIDDLVYGHLEIELGVDCKSKDGLTILASNELKNSLVGCRLLKDNKPLTPDIIQTLIGKEITIRTPGHCKLKSGYCEYCMGDISKRGKYTIPSAVSVIDSNNMSAQMAAGHGKAKNLQRISIDQLE